MDIRVYDESRDLAAIKRVWREVGWVENDKQARFIKDFLSVGTCLTAHIDGTAECAVHTLPGSICYLEHRLQLCAVTAVTTSRIARKQGFALRLTAKQLAGAALEGAEVAALGMFEQGYYDKLGFGTAAYEHIFKFDPATLMVDAEFAVPRRLGKKDWRDIHSAMSNRMPHHGACFLFPPQVMKAELGFTEDGFGLGYYDNNDLTHFFWCTPEGEYGPYDLSFLAYRTPDQLVELLALIKSLADQVSSISMIEPPHVQLQAMLKQPFRHQRNTRNSKHGNEHTARAWSQLRIMDLPACLSRHTWPGDAFTFNLRIEDPLARHLTGEDWSGIGGEYIVEAGTPSSASPGRDDSAPDLSASCGAFSRLFFGVTSASSLSITDGLRAPADLLRRLDAAFCLPLPRMSWEF